MESTHRGRVRATSSRHFTRLRLTATVGACAIALVASDVAATTFAGATTLAVNAISASRSTLPPQGGALSVSATPTMNAKCSLVVSPPGPVIPAPVDCKAGVKVTIPLFFSGNTAARRDPYKNFMQACANGTCVKSVAVVVVQWGIGVTLASSVGPWAKPTSASCPTATFCAVADGSSYVVTGAKSKYRRVLLQQGRLIQSVSCSSPTFCVAGDLVGDGFTWNGLTWKKTTTQTFSAPAVSVFASAASQRKAGMLWVQDAGGGAFSDKVLVFNGTSWGSPITVATPGTPRSISCVGSLPECFVVDSKGALTSFGGPLPPSSFALSSTGAALNSVSCPSANSCAAGGDGGFLVRKLTGRTTFQPITLSSAKPIIGVSCSTDTLCFVSTSASVTIAIGDLNRDGLPDIVACSSAPQPFAGSVVISAVPGVAGQIVSFGKGKEAAGHVTLYK